MVSDINQDNQRNMSRGVISGTQFISKNKGLKSGMCSKMAKKRSNFGPTIRVLDQLQNSNPFCEDSQGPLYLIVRDYLVILDAPFPLLLIVTNRNFPGNTCNFLFSTIISQNQTKESLQNHNHFIWPRVIFDQATTKGCVFSMVILSPHWRYMSSIATKNLVPSEFVLQRTDSKKFVRTTVLVQRPLVEKDELHSNQKLEKNDVL